MMGILLDVPHVAEKATQRLDAAGLLPCCEVVAGDALDSVPSGAEAYLLSRVIHDWADTEAVKILANCARAMGPHVRLLLIERVLPARIEP
jgi:hypothetical protein